jgi:hypothetical protein
MGALRKFRDLGRLVVFWSCFVLSACVLYVVIMVPTLCLLLVHSRRVIMWRRSFASAGFAVFCDIVAALVCNVCGIHVSVSAAGDEHAMEALQGDGNVVVMMNTPPPAAFGGGAGVWGWILGTCCYGSALRRSGDLRMIVNDRLRGVPVVGWATQALLFVFIGREKRRAVNIATIKRVFGFLLCTGAGRTAMLVFPMSRKKYSGADGAGAGAGSGDGAGAGAGASAEGEGEMVVRPSGFVACVERLREIDSVCDDSSSGARTSSSDSGSSNSGGNNGAMVTKSGPAAIHDVTITAAAAEEGGVLPSSVHISIARHDLADVPTDGTGLGAWLTGRCEAKKAIVDAVAKGTDGAEMVSHDHCGGRQLAVQPYSQALLLGTAMALGLLLLPWVRVLVAALIIASVAARAVGGVDMVDLALHGDMVTNLHSCSVHDVSGRLKGD